MKKKIKVEQEIEVTPKFKIGDIVCYEDGSDTIVVQIFSFVVYGDGRIMYRFRHGEQKEYLYEECLKLY